MIAVEDESNNERTVFGGKSNYNLSFQSRKISFDNKEYVEISFCQILKRGSILFALISGTLAYFLYA